MTSCRWGGDGPAAGAGGGIGPADGGGGIGPTDGGGSGGPAGGDGGLAAGGGASAFADDGELDGEPRFSKAKMASLPRLVLYRFKERKALLE